MADNSVDQQTKRIERIVDVAIGLADLLLSPPEKDAAKRAAQREKAYEGLIHTINTLASLARASEDYTALLEASLSGTEDPEFGFGTPAGAQKIPPSGVDHDS